MALLSKSASPKVKFARTGGEANAIAIRLARATTAKKKIAVCGYHGWHDWYLSIDHNYKNKKDLDKLLFPGISLDGVPKSLKRTAFAFKYNDINGLKKLITWGNKSID